MGRIILYLFILFVSLNFTGCLSTQYKEYLFKINPDGSGKGTITFRNIVSIEDDEKDVSFKDFGELISDYMEGTRFEDDNPNYQVLSKELIAEDSILVGKVEFTFNNFKDIGFFKPENCDCSPIMYYIGDFGETFSETNGDYLGDEKNIPLIIWEQGENEFSINTIVQEDLTNTHGLLKLYNTWKDNQ